MRHNSIGERIEAIGATLPQGVTLIAVSKYHPIEAIAQAYEAGQRDFGESKAQDLTAKHTALPADIKWHFIGHLQTNKVKYIAPFIHLIHNIDSYKLLCEVDRQAAKAGRKISCLLQIHIAQEETKFGLTPQECRELLDAGEWRTLENVELRGIMCMA
ncbi:MAG: YggS family pyridoxal phosphate-dependent enzyme, partial [Bacteroidaceae bacterium]|nr:YggS family pyridoxal phosphate-dependent enzyme [Bacteroidaceae bacterium]